MAHPDNPKRFVSYTDLRRVIVGKMESGGDGIKDCDLVNRALLLARTSLLRSPGFPVGVNVVDDTSNLARDILRRHREFCKNPNSHPYA